MNTKRSYIWLPIIILVLVAVIGGAVYVSMQTTDDQGQPVAPPDYQITLDNLSPVDPIYSPFVLRGEARGGYFENQRFPVELQDQNGNVISRGTAVTTISTTTDEYIPFTVSLNFPDQPSNTAGQLNFLKADSTGDPARNYVYSVGVRF
jgi:hypothetical protein